MHAVRGEEDGLLRSMAAAGESVAAITTAAKAYCRLGPQADPHTQFKLAPVRQGRRQKRRRGNDFTWLKTANGGHLGKMPCFEGW